MAEHWNNGPSGILANPAWRFQKWVPQNDYLRLSFAFNAAWEKHDLGLPINLKLGRRQ